MLQTPTNTNTNTKTKTKINTNTKETIPVLKNGAISNYEDSILKTYYTCAFDSWAQIFLALFIDKPRYVQRLFEKNCDIIEFLNLIKVRHSFENVYELNLLNQNTITDLGNIVSFSEKKVEIVG